MGKSDKERYRRGDPHPSGNGLVFAAYDKTMSAGMRWVAPEKLAEIRAKAKAKSHEVEMRRREYKKKYNSDPAFRARRIAAYAKKRAENPIIKKPKIQTPEYLAAYNLAWKKRKRREDPIFRMKLTARNMVNRAVKAGMKRSYKTSREVIGCTPQELKIYLEGQFKDGMSWGNHGLSGWHVDHIIPLSSGVTHDDFLRLSHYTNLQPLWWHENLSKAARVHPQGSLT